MGESCDVHASGVHLALPAYLPCQPTRADTVGPCHASTSLQHDDCTPSAAKRLRLNHEAPEFVPADTASVLRIADLARQLQEWIDISANLTMSLFEVV